MTALNFCASRTTYLLMILMSNVHELTSLIIGHRDAFYFSYQSLGTYDDAPHVIGDRRDVVNK